MPHPATLHFAIPFLLCCTKLHAAGRNQTKRCLACIAVCNLTVTDAARPRRAFRTLPALLRETALVSASQTPNGMVVPVLLHLTSLLHARKRRPSFACSTTPYRAVLRLTKLRVTCFALRHDGGPDTTWLCWAVPALPHGTERDLLGLTFPALLRAAPVDSDTSCDACYSAAFSSSSETMI
jgi:hypothetical protein